MVAKTCRVTTPNLQQANRQIPDINNVTTGLPVCVPAECCTQLSCTAASLTPFPSISAPLAPAPAPNLPLAYSPAPNLSLAPSRDANPPLAPSQDTLAPVTSSSAGERD